MSEVSNTREIDLSGGYTTTKESLAEWVVYTTVDASGVTIKRVGFPKRPIATRDELKASLESDELYQPSST